MTEPTRVTARRATPADAETVQLLVLELADHENTGQHVHVDVPRWRELLAEPDVVVRLAEHAAGDRLVVRWELNADNDGARRFYVRLGATVRDKGVATWQPHDYTALLAHDMGTRLPGGH